MRLTVSLDKTFPSAKEIDQEIRNALVPKLLEGLKQVQDAILTTPVYTGATLANFRWSLTNPIEETRAPVKKPRFPGKTSVMPLGSEPRRAANAKLVGSEYAAIVRAVTRQNSPYYHIYLLNNKPNFSDIEYGSYRDGARTPPGGMTRRGESRLRLAIPGLKKSE